MSDDARKHLIDRLLKNQIESAVQKREPLIVRVPSAIALVHASLHPPPKPRRSTHRWRARCRAAGLSRRWIRFLAERRELLLEFLTSTEGALRTMRELDEHRLKTLLAITFVRPISKPVGYRQIARQLVTVEPL